MNARSSHHSGSRSRRQRRTNPWLALLLSPTYWPVDFFEWLVPWVWTRRWLRVLPAIPFIILTAAVVLGTTMGQRVAQASRVPSYLKNAVEAHAKDDEATFLFYCHLLEEIDMNDGSKFDVARFFEDHGRTVRARELLTELVSKEGGYWKAHLWMVKKHRQSGIPVHRDNLDERRRHANGALPQGKDDPDLNLELAEINDRLGNTAETIAYLEAAAKERPQVYFDLMLLSKKIGDERRMRTYQDRAETYFQNQLEADPTVFQSRALLVRTFLFGGKAQEAIELARQGFQSSRDAKNRDLLMDCYTYAYNALSPEARKGSEGIELLKKNLQLLPDHLPTLERIALLVGQVSDIDEELRKALDQAVQSGNSPASLHKLLAAGYLKQQQYDIAKDHLEYALRKSPQDPEILNNLAWCYAVSSTPELDRAQLLIDQAVRLVSLGSSLKNFDIFELQETRGLIKLKRGLYQDAISDLEPLQSVFPTRAYLKRLLADAYEKIGNATVATELRKQADRIEKVDRRE